MHGKKRFKQVLEWYDGVFGFAKTKFYFERKKIDQKLANRHAELVFWKKCRITWNEKSPYELSSEIRDA